MGSNNTTVRNNPPAARSQHQLLRSQAVPHHASTQELQLSKRWQDRSPLRPSEEYLQRGVRTREHGCSSYISVTLQWKQ